MFHTQTVEVTKMHITSGPLILANNRQLFANVNKAKLQCAYYKT